MGQLKHYNWDHFSASYQVVHAAIYILDCITYNKVERFYKERCFYFTRACVEINI
jgi:hypothetical protein